jgi:hypothetical protein
MKSQTFKIVENKQTGMIGLIPTNSAAEKYLRKRIEIDNQISITIEPKVDAEINAKFHKLISIIADPDGSLPERLEYFFFEDEVVDDREDRHDRIRKRIFREIGFVNIQELKLGTDVFQIKQEKSIREIKDKVEYQEIYTKCKNYIFEMLKKNGWSESDLDKAFECLYFGVSLEQYKAMR